MKFQFSLVEAIMFKYNIMCTFAQNAKYSILRTRDGKFIIVAHNEEAAKGATPEQILEGQIINEGFSPIATAQFNSVKIDEFAIEHLHLKGYAYM